ncbi:MAG: PAS domain S-box protein [Nitrospirota bacterium]|nr:PAS domain S-box protein [Nitrospirota bacterium]
MGQEKKSPSNSDTLRQKAETALTTTRAQVKQMTPEEVQHLVHELQVHQIELKMQNEELSQTQLELEDARDRYATLFDFTPVGYATLDGKGRILEANLTLCQLVGVQRSAILHKKFEEFIDPEDQPAFRLYLESMKTKAGTQSSEVLTLRHTETLHRVRLESCLETLESPDMGGELFRITIVDVTERERIAAMQDEQKALMAVVVGGVMDAILTTDEDERIVLFNKAAENMFRCPASRAIGQPIDRFIPERFRSVHQMQHRHFGQPAVALCQMSGAQEVMVQRADGDEFPAEITISHIALKGWGKAKSKTLVTVVLRDITDQRRQQEEQHRISKLNSLGVLAGGIAHDFNNLLTTILGNMFVAKLQMVPKDGPLTQNLEQAEQACLRAKELTQQFLTFAKGGAPIKTSIPFGDLLRKSTTFALSGSSISCHFDIPENLWPLDADPGQLRQVIQNITINARQAMPQGGHFTVKVENVGLKDPSILPSPSLIPGNYLKISFEDQGTGIEDRRLSNIFDPYYTTKPDAPGLGLATVHSIIQQHHGHISVTSTVGVGTAFTIYLPSSYSTTGSGQQSLPAIPQKGCGRVLVMDDEQSIRRMAEDALTYFGYEAVTVQDGQAAIDQVSRSLVDGKKFDVVILDLTIPGAMGGKDAMQHLRRIDPQIKAIVTSGYSDDPIMCDFQKYGFQGILVKPYKISDLAILLESICLSVPHDTIH